MNHTCLFWTILIVTLIFVCWAEYSLGNVFLRSDCRGGKSFNFRSLLHLMTHPLHNKTLWNKHSMDLNYPFVITMTLLGYSIFI